MNCIIAGSDSLTRFDLEYRIREIDFVNLIGSCTSASEATKSIMSQQVDLIVLDAIMPQMNGLQLIHELNAEIPQIVLVSSDKEFAAEAFNFNVTDFLLKPVSDERLFYALAKAKRIYDSRTAVSSLDDHYVFIRANSLLVKIKICDILFIEAMPDYVTIHTVTNTYTVHSSLKKIGSALPGNQFFRTHNAYIIRLDKISKIDSNCVIIEKKLIPISRSKLDDLMKKIKILVNTKNKRAASDNPTALQSTESANKKYDLAY